MTTAAHRQSRLAGDVVLRSPVSVTLATAAICLLLLATILLAALVTYPREAVLSGWLEPAPDGGLRAVLVAPVADAAYLEPGRTLALRLPAAPGPEGALTGIVEPRGGDAPQQGGAVRVTLRIEAQPAMQAGAPVTARVALGRVSLLSLAAGSAFRRPNA